MAELLGAQLLGGSPDDTTATGDLLGATMLGGDVGSTGGGGGGGTPTPPAGGSSSGGGMLGDFGIGWTMLAGDAESTPPVDDGRLTGAIHAGSMLTGHLHGAVRLAGTISARSELTGHLRAVRIKLTGPIRAGTLLTGHLRLHLRLHGTVQAGSQLAYVSLHQVTTQTRTLALFGAAAAEQGISQPSESDREPVTARTPSLGW